MTKRKRRKAAPAKLLSNKVRSALRRAAIDRRLAAGEGAETIAAAFADAPLSKLIEGMKDAPRAVAREIAMVVAARAVDPRATAQADHIADLRQAIADAQAQLADSTGSEHRLRMDQIERFRQTLAEAEGLGLMPPRPKGPQRRSPEQGRPTGQHRNKAGRLDSVDALKREPPPVDRPTREPQGDDDEVEPDGPVWDLTPGRYQQDDPPTAALDKPEPTKPKAEPEPRNPKGTRRDSGAGAVPPEYR